MEGLPILKVGPEQLASFVPIAPVIEAFAEEHGLRVSRLFDSDPVTPGASYFIG